MIGVLLAVPGVADEPALVQGAAGHGMRVLRRCVDAVDLLAAAAAEPTAQVVLSASLPRLTADAVDRMRVGRRVVGLARDGIDADALAALGVDPVLRVGASTDATLRLLAATFVDLAPSTHGETPTPAISTTGSSVRDAVAPGGLVAVWGPQGAPGRSTIAIGVAEAMADAGRSVLLVDADTYAPSLTLALGVVEEASGLIVACRHAESGSGRAQAVSSSTRQVRGTLHLLGGLPGAERWAELRSGALERVWSASRESFDVVVVDVGFCLEQDTDAVAWSRRRNAAALTALAAADHVLAVADGSGPGAARLCAAWPGLLSAAAVPSIRLVRNRATGSDREWARAVAAGGVRAAIHPVPRDDRAVSTAWRMGRTLGEGSRRSRIRRAVDAVAADLLAGPALTPARS